MNGTSLERGSLPVDVVCQVPSHWLVARVLELRLHEIGGGLRFREEASNRFASRVLLRGVEGAVIVRVVIVAAVVADVAFHAERLEDFGAGCVGGILRNGPQVADAIVVQGREAA